jgi:hypothetical protein
LRDMRRNLRRSSIDNEHYIIINLITVYFRECPTQPVDLCLPPDSWFSYFPILKMDVFLNRRPFSELQVVITQKTALSSRTKFHENPSSGTWGIFNTFLYPFLFSSFHLHSCIFSKQDFDTYN